MNNLTLNSSDSIIKGYELKKKMKIQNSKNNNSQNNNSPKGIDKNKSEKNIICENGVNLSQYRVVSDIQDTYTIDGSLSNLMILLTERTKQCDISSNLYNFGETDTAQMYKFTSYLRIPAPLCQFKIEIDKDDFVVFYINNSFVVDNGVYGGTTYKEKTEGSRLSYTSNIIDFDEENPFVAMKLLYIKSAESAIGLKISWRYTSDGTDINSKSFKIIKNTAFKLKDDQITYVPTIKNAEKVEGLLYNAYDLQVSENGRYKGGILIKNKPLNGGLNFDMNFLRKTKPAKDIEIDVGPSKASVKTVQLPYPSMRVEIIESSRPDKSNFSLKVDQYTLEVQNNYGFIGSWDTNLKVRARTTAGENVYIHIVGYIRIPKKMDNLKFKATSDDGILFSFDDKELINDWGDHGPRTTESGNLKVDEDYYYKIDLQYYNRGGNGGLDIQWNINGVWENIDNEYFYYISGMNDEDLDYGRDTQTQKQRTSVATGSKKEIKKSEYVQGYFLTSFELDRRGGRNTGSPKKLIEPTKLIINKNISYNWGRGSVFGLRRDNIYNVIEGYIHIPERKTFKLATRADDGIRLSFDNSLVVDDWGDHGARQRESKNIKKNAGKYPFRIEHYEAGGGAAIIILWNFNGKWEVIPSKNFFVKNDISAVQFFEKDRQKEYRIEVGKSSKQEKTIDLPVENLAVSPIPLNKQHPKWTDTFETKVVGKKLTVRRSDANAGWGQNLILSAEHINQRNLINLNDKSKYEIGTNVNVYELVARKSERLRWTLMGKTRIRQEINFNWASKNTVAINGIGRKDNVFMEFYGSLYIPEKSGNVYFGKNMLAKFKIGSDDGTRLFLDGNLIIDNWRDQGYREKTSGYTTVQPGTFHQYKVEFYERGSSSRLTLKWNLTQQGFNENEYLTMYPDVKRNWRAPAVDHWNRHGKKEGRLSGDFRMIPKENLYTFKNNKNTQLSNLFTEVSSEFSEIELIGNSWTKPKFNSLIDFTNFNSFFSFRMSFEIRPLGYVQGWTNILAMKFVDNNYAVRGARFPAIWFFNNSTRLHIVCGGNSRERYNASINPPEHLPLNKVHFVTIERNINGFKVFLQIQNEDNTYRDTRQYSRVCEGLNSLDIKLFENAKFWFSDKHHKAADCEIKNLRLEML